MKDMLKTLDRNKIISIYAVLLLGVMPILVSPWQNDVFYYIKIWFVLFITLPVFIFLAVRDGIPKLKKLNTLLLIYAILLIVSTIFSIDKGVSLFGQKSLPEGIVSLLMYIMIFCIFTKYKNPSIKALDAIFVFAALVSIYGILQYYKILPEIIPAGGKKTFINLSTIGNRNFVGTYCTLILPVSVWLYMVKGYKRYFGYSSLLFGLLLSSMTRSAWVSFGIYFPVLLFFILKDKSSLKRAAVLMGVFVVIFLCINLSPLTNEIVSTRAQTIVNDVKNIQNEKSGSYRVFIWKNIIPLLFERPIIGNGPDTFEAIYSKYPVQINLTFNKAHNEYLQIGVTTGWPSLIVYLLIVGIVIFRIFKYMKNERWTLAIFCSILGYLIQANFNISVISTAPIYWAMLGIGGRELVIENEELRMES